MSDVRQQAYELRRRARILGLAIDQCLTGMKNIIVHSNYKLWMIDDPGLVDAQKWMNIKDNAETLLMETMKLERKLASMADIYATLVPQNPEATPIHENATTNKD